MLAPIARPTLARGAPHGNYCERQHWLLSSSGSLARMNNHMTEQLLIRVDRVALDRFADRHSD